MLRLSALVTALLGSQAAASAQSPPPVINAPLNSMLQVIFEDEQPNFSPAQNAVIREIVGSAKSAPGSAMVLCYRFGPNRVADFRLMNDRFASVARALRAEGASTVFKGSAVLCQTLSKPQQKAVIQIHRLSPAN